MSDLIEWFSWDGVIIAAFVFTIFNALASNKEISTMWAILAVAFAVLIVGS